MCGKSIDAYFAGEIESIGISLKFIYRSFAGIKEDAYSFTRKKNEVADFYFDCPNPECTESYFDLRSEIGDLYARKGDVLKGEKVCKGKAAPDHPNQRCDTTMEYEIEITYSK